MSVVGCRLLVSVDKQKDQTYFLWTLTQRELSRTLFPIGHLTKPAVRKLAKKFGLPTAEKKDSQGLCFVGKVDLPDFLSHFLKPKRGDVLDENGKKIGWHNGAFFLTIGQRHGFTISEKTPADAPYYIVAKDIKKNAITVSQKTKRLSLKAKPFGSVILRDVNWIASKAPDFKKIYFARFRYRQPLEAIRFNLEVRFQNPQTAIASGQSLVIYSKTGECLGGGIIV